MDTTNANAPADGVKARKRISWDVSPADGRIISKIVDRAEALAAKYGAEFDRQTLAMDLHACHANGCPLALGVLLKFPDFDFTHDVFGIHRHIDRKTGELGDSFSPRSAATYHRAAPDASLALAGLREVERLMKGARP